MRRLVITWAIALVCMVIQGIGAAQSIPSGSYQQSCKNIGVQDEVLSANCQDRDGKWEATQLRDYRNCGGDIMNDNGALRCGNTVNGAAVSYPGSYPGGQAGVPSGSYTQTCQEVRVHGDDLEARCQAMDAAPLTREGTRWSPSLRGAHGPAIGVVPLDPGRRLHTRRLRRGGHERRPARPLVGEAPGGA